MHSLSLNFPFVAKLGADEMKVFSSAEVNQALRQLKMPFTSTVQKWRVDYTPCFDANSETGNLILDFLTHTVRFRVTAPPQLREEVMSFLRSACSPEDIESRSSETSARDNEVTKYFGNIDWEAVMCFRPKKIGQ